MMFVLVNKLQTILKSIFDQNNWFNFHLNVCTSALASFKLCTIIHCFAFLYLSENINSKNLFHSMWYFIFFKVEKQVQNKDHIMGSKKKWCFHSHGNQNIIPENLLISNDTPGTGVCTIFVHLILKMMWLGFRTRGLLGLHSFSLHEKCVLLYCFISFFFWFGFSFYFWFIEENLQKNVSVA